MKFIFSLSLFILIPLTSMAGESTLADVADAPALAGRSFEQMSPSERAAFAEYAERNGGVVNKEPGRPLPSNQRVVAVLRCDPLAAVKKPGESQSDFRKRYNERFQFEVFIDGKVYRRWLTSPGQEGWDKVNNFDMRTDLTSPPPKGSGGTQAVATYREWEVGKSKSYAGFKMPYAVRLGGANSGFFVHATPYVKALGRPDSHGCIRLSRSNAKEFYDLTNKVGPSNVNVHFAGYSCDPKEQAKQLPPDVQKLYRPSAQRREKPRKNLFDIFKRN